MMERSRDFARHAAGITPLPCACANLRRAERVVTQIYDAALRPSGLRITQFTLLQALENHPGISQKQLAQAMDIDSTTLTRTLALLRRQGWLSSAEADDRRELRLHLTLSGKRKLASALPAWEAAQARLRKALGGGAAWRRTQEALLHLTRSARRLH